jgi:indole-3-glycerol phosphate synthase
MKSEKIQAILNHKKISFKNNFDNFKDMKRMVQKSRPGIDLEKEIKKKNKNGDVAVICEFKPASPSKGVISNFFVEDMVNIYQKNGAAAISILTEEKFFGSSIKNLIAAKNGSNIPLIMKDFIVEEYQIYGASLAGASSILLIVNIFPDLEKGINISRLCNMEPLIECHNIQEIRDAENAGAKIIGINNRNLNNLSIDLERTKKMASEVPEDIILVSESGVNGPENLEFLAKSGADAVLVGTHLMSSQNLFQASEKVKILIKSANGARCGR